MQRILCALVGASALLAAPQFAFADGNNTGTAIVGGAVAGALVGGPVGAVVGGVAGAVVGGATQPVAPCNSSTTHTTDNNGNSSTTQSTNCPN